MKATIKSFEPVMASEIAEIEKVCFSSPWSKQAILDSYENGISFFAALSDEKVIGYAGLQVVVDEGYVTNIAVLPQFRRNGIATALINTVFSFAAEKKLSFVSLEVRQSNAEAQRLYEKLGFLYEGKRPGFYTLPTEDAIIMTRRFHYENTCN